MMLVRLLKMIKMLGRSVVIIDTTTIRDASASKGLQERHHRWVHRMGRGGRWQLYSLALANVRMGTMSLQPK